MKLVHPCNIHVSMVRHEHCKGCFGQKKLQVKAYVASHILDLFMAVV